MVVRVGRNFIPSKSRILDAQQLVIEALTYYYIS